MQMISFWRVAVLLAISITPRLSYAETYQDWFFSSSSDHSHLTALTANDGGAVLVFDCTLSTRTCAWSVISHKSCEDDRVYNVLVHVGETTQSIDARCSYEEGALGRYRLAFQNYAAMNQLLAQADNVRFAIETRPQQFRQLRFSLAGAGQARSRLVTLANKIHAPRRVSVNDSRTSSERSR